MLRSKSPAMREKNKFHAKTDSKKKILNVTKEKIF